MTGRAERARTTTTESAARMDRTSHLIDVIMTSGVRIGRTGTEHCSGREAETCS